MPNNHEATAVYPWNGNKIDTMNPRKDFTGLTVAAFESRMAQEMTRLIERYQGKPEVAPSMQEIPLEDNPQALVFGEQLLLGHFDMVVLLTGAGTKRLLRFSKRNFHSRQSKKPSSKPSSSCEAPSLSPS